MLRGFLTWLILAYRMMRVRTVFMMIIFAAIGAIAASPGVKLDLSFLLVFIMLAALFTCATCINDISDEEIDRINLAKDKSRPLVTAGATAHQLIVMAVFSTLTALLAAWLVRPAVVWLAILSAVLAYIYSMPPIKISYRGVLAIVLLPINYVVIPFLSGVLLYHGTLSSEVILLLSALYVSFIGRILLKDFRDVKGDKRFGKRTFLIRYGAKLTCYWAIFSWLAGDVIISTLYYEKFSLFVWLIQPFIAATVLTLYSLSIEGNYTRQLFLVTLVGRLGNSVILMLLTVLSLTAFNYSQSEKDLMLCAVAFASGFFAFEVYKLYSAQPTLKNALGKK